MSDGPSHPAAHPAVNPPAALPRGTRLGEFELLHVLGVGGFAIVYLAFDHQLEREVAVKEYMPTTLAGRTETLQVSLRSQSDADTFALGLKSFVNEARLLARFDLPSLVRVHRFWEAHGTAYMAMPVVRGQSAKAWRLSQTSPPDEAWLRALLDPLLDTLEKLHAEAVYHRDIAPDNIQIDEDGRPVLLDLGAARRVIGDATQTLTAILKPAYAPIEQYAEVGALRQGAWTDLYALGATVHFLLLGRPPLPATARALHDELPPLAGQTLPGVSLRFLQVVDWMLSPRPQDRPQSVDMLRDALQGRVAPPAPLVPAQAAPVQWEHTQRLPGGPLTPPAEAGASDPAATVRRTTPRADPTPDPEPTVPGALTGASMTRDVAERAKVASAAGTVTPAATARVPTPARRSRMPVVVGVGGVLVVLAVAGAWLGAGAGDGHGGGLTPSAAGPAVTVTAAVSPPASSARVSPVSAAAAPDEPQATGSTADAPGAQPADVAPQRVDATGTSATVEPPGTLSTPGGTRPSTGSSPAVARTGVAPPPTRRTPVQQLSTQDPTPRPVEVAAALPLSGPSQPPVQAALQPPVTPAPESAPLSAAPTSAPPTLQGPVERCGRRVLIALWNCVDRQCREPELRNHPECVKLREDRERNVRGRF